MISFVLFDVILHTLHSELSSTGHSLFENTQCPVLFSKRLEFVGILAKIYKNICSKLWSLNDDVIQYHPYILISFLTWWYLLKMSFLLILLNKLRQTKSISIIYIHGHKYSHNGPIFKRWLSLTPVHYAALSNLYNAQEHWPQATDRLGQCHAMASKSLSLSSLLNYWTSFFFDTVDTSW